MREIGKQKPTRSFIALGIVLLVVGMITVNAIPERSRTSSSGAYFVASLLVVGGLVIAIIGVVRYWKSLK